MDFNLEEVYTVFHGYSGKKGANYASIRKWFKVCQIIDGKLLTEELFEKSYVRIEPNKGNLNMTQFILLIGILSRDTNQSIKLLLTKFEKVKETIIQEIRRRPRKKKRRKRRKEPPDTQIL